MKVKVLVPMAGPNLVCKRGDFIDITDKDELARLLNAGRVEQVKRTRKKKVEKAVR